MKTLVMAASGAALFDGDQLLEAIRARNGDHARVQPSPEDWETDYDVYVALETRTLIVSHFKDSMSVGFEGGDVEVRDAIAWYRSLLPPDPPRVVATDHGWYGHVDLHHGITADEIAQRWVDHSTPGWEVGDPDFGQ
jgi:hypothetical protein